MKNIHLIPTDEPSRLAGSEYITNEQGIDKRVFKFKLWDKLIPNKDLKDVGYIPQHIYITSDEEIKEGDWIISTNELLIKSSKSYCANNEYGEKIILTTDQDLIEDGIQPIDDTFLEWFVKNPSCESIEIRDYKLHFGSTIYKIIIPKEEPKQYPIGGYAPGYYSCTCVTCKKEFTGDKRAVQCKPCAIQMTREEPKQETIEEAANNWIKNTSEFLSVKNGFIEGAKWQAERMYSEANKIMKFLDTEKELKLSDAKTIERIKWYFETYFEQFKKK